MGDEIQNVSALSDVGGHVVLALLNTVVQEDGLRVDHLSKDASAFAWLRERRLISDTLSSAPRGLAPALQHAREVIRLAFEAIIAGHVPDVSELNRLLAGGLGNWQLSLMDRHRLHLRFDRREGGVVAAVAPITEAAASLLASSAAYQVKHCANPACTMLFIDPTSTGRRRWCDMARCGNRTKVNAFRARTRKQAK